jgi:hypothetical protein
MLLDTLLHKWSFECKRQDSNMVKMNWPFGHLLLIQHSMGLVACLCKMIFMFLKNLYIAFKLGELGKLTCLTKLCKLLESREMG